MPRVAPSHAGLIFPLLRDEISQVIWPSLDAEFSLKLQINFGDMFRNVELREFRIKFGEWMTWTKLNVGPVGIHERNSDSFNLNISRLCEKANVLNIDKMLN